MRRASSDLRMPFSRMDWYSRTFRCLHRQGHADISCFTFRRRRNLLAIRNARLDSLLKSAQRMDQRFLASLAECGEFGEIRRGHEERAIVVELEVNAIRNHFNPRSFLIL